jgi:hypothetical protein
MKPRSTGFTPYFGPAQARAVTVVEMDLSELDDTFLQVGLQGL